MSKHRKSSRRNAFWRSNKQVGRPQSLSSASGQRTYTHAIDEFVGWYCSEPRLAFNRGRARRKLADGRTGPTATPNTKARCPSPSGAWLPVQYGDDGRRVLLNDAMYQEALPIRRYHVLLPIVALPRGSTEDPRGKQRDGRAGVRSRAM